jgi:eukaryotic-like serine/threonine-protein kinase
MVRGPDDVDLAGAVLNQRWRVVRGLGSGGLGVVVEVVGLSGEGARAAKLLRREFLDEAEVVERFLGEAELGSRLAHPGIVQVLEAARAEDGTPYLVMELCRGEPLAALMNRDRLPVERAVVIVHSLLDALGAAHRAGLVHRDIKPDNVFLAEDGAGREAVKLLDFGVARALEAAGGVARRTRTGMLLGTPGYMSPEQLKRVKDAGPTSDLWAVGIVFYELLTGQRAFPASSEFERMTAVLTRSPVPIEKVAPQYAHWAPFFARALDADPRRRFATAAEMDAALLGAARGEFPRESPRPSPAAPGPAGGPFGGIDTALSPIDSLGAGAGRSAPEVVVLPRRPKVVSLAAALIMSAVAGVLGLAVGYFCGVR